MSTREELADTIAVTLRGEDQFGYTDISDLGDAVLDSRYDLLAVADAVLADYQPKPRTVTTEAELDALPVNSVVVDTSGVPRTKRYGDSHMGAGWTHAGRGPLRSCELVDGQPMTVVFTPEATA